MLLPRPALLSRIFPDSPAGTDLWAARLAFSAKASKTMDVGHYLILIIILIIILISILSLPPPASSRFKFPPRPRWNAALQKIQNPTLKPL